MSLDAKHYPFSLPTDHFKANTGYRDAPARFEFTTQGVKTITRQIKVGRVVRLIEVNQNIPNTPDLLCPNAARIIVLIQALQTPVPERPQPQITAPCIGTGVNVFLLRLARSMIRLCDCFG